MGDWSAAASSIAQGVSSVASTVKSYGPNDQGKAVRAAKNAGKQAQKVESKKWPAWASGGKAVAQDLGIDSKGLYKRAKAEAEQDAYDQAYQQVWELYEESKKAQVNHDYNSDPDQELQLELAQQQAMNAGMLAGMGAGSSESKSAGMGCVVASLMLFGASSVLSGVVYLLYNLIS